MDLSGRVVLITGASAGIGEATAYEFAKHGSKLILFARRGDRLNEVRDAILQQYPNVEIHTHAVNVRNKEEIDNAMRNLPDNFKNVDVLVNNAGLAIGFDPLEQNKQEDIRTVLETNIDGMIWMIQAVLPIMKERNSGDIINMGSISGQQTHQYGNALYSTTKFALEGLTQSIRKEVYATKIRVVLIRPGAVHTDFTKSRAIGRPEIYNTFYDGFQPLVAKDVAETVVFAAARPSNVVISELTILPNAQADMLLINREKGTGPLKIDDKS